MLFSREVKSSTGRSIRYYMQNRTFQRWLIGIATVLVAFFIVENGALPLKYKLTLGEKSQYDITAPRDIENRLKTGQSAIDAAAAVPPVMTVVSTASIDVLNNLMDFVTAVDNARKYVVKKLEDQGVTRKSGDYGVKLSQAQSSAAVRLSLDIRKQSLPLSENQVQYLVVKLSDEKLESFRKIMQDIVSEVMRDDITKSSLAAKINDAQNVLQGMTLEQDLKNIGVLVIKAVLKPNRTVNDELTRQNREKEYKDAIKNKEMILKDSRILSKGDIVTADKLQVLKDLNLLDTRGDVDILFAFSIFAMLLMLSAVLVIYMNHFIRRLLYSRNANIMLSVIIILVLLIARFVGGYSHLAIPVFIAAMLISILLDIELAAVVNCILAIAISLIIKGDLVFLYMTIISGVFAAFLVSKANQRSRLSMVGAAVGALNMLVVASVGIINKNDSNTIINDSIIVFLNGMISVILTIGLLPFFESAFKIVTPMKLLELANPNQPLMKKLMMEAPGTYHHSLMVGNLAEVATEAIGGDALLARVASYFHDIGKLKRPNFFKENQLADNPHDRMTANLSTLVITSHTQDGMEIAARYKIPEPIRDIISQHHGTTLVAYFYHKARKGDRGESIKPENFRYEGPRPSTKEAAVVMLADSIEAAVRSMMDKTEGKIEGLVRKIIKDKLDDGQLDICDLTLKDLDTIAKGFMRVLSGFFHEREEYPDVSMKPDEHAQTADDSLYENGLAPDANIAEEEKLENGSSNYN